jgi:hypothetical protein
MRNKFTAITLVTAIIILLLACSENEPTPFQVFVGGEDVLDTMTSGVKLPTVWINGEAKYLNTNDGELAHNYLKDVVSNDGHFYSTGYANTTNGWVAKVWRDKEEINSFAEPNANYNGNAITVSNGDIYVAAVKADLITERQLALVIKNSTVTVLNSSANTSAHALSIAVSGNDVYVGGWEDNNARLWKNGSIIELPNSQSYRINSIAVVGSDVYALGECNCWDGARVRYWKNGVSSDLSSESEIAFGYGLAVSGTDVYVAGADYVGDKWRAKFWKNTLGTTLTPEGSNGWARDIVLHGSTVYVAGEQLSSNLVFRYAMLWTDGEATRLGTRRSSAFAVAINKSN